MSGICSAHQGHKAGCPQCEASSKVHAEKICDWLTGDQDWPVPREDLTNWLASDAGTVAMIEKLVREYGIRLPLPWLDRGEHPIIYGVHVLGKTHQAPTLNAALQSAILELIGGE